MVRGTTLRGFGPLALLSACVLFSACSKQDYGRRQDMRIARLSAVISEHTSTSDEWELPKTRYVKITACMNDQGRERPVMGQTYEVYRVEDNQKMPVDDKESSESTNTGCTTWTEDFQLDAFAQPTYIKINRRLQPSSFYHPIELHAAVNPWKGWNGSDPAIVNLDWDLQVPRLEKFDLQEVPFKVESIQYSFNLDDDSPSTQGMSGKLILNFPPTIQLTGMAGGFNPPQAITKGVFRIRPQIWRVQADGQMFPVTTDIGWSKDMPFNNSVFTSQVQTLHFEKIERSGAYYLILAVEPVRAPKALLGFVKAYKMGDWTSVPGGTGRLEPNFRMPPELFPAVLKQSTIRHASRYQFDMIRGNRIGVPPNFEEAPNRSAVQTTFSVAVLNNLDQASGMPGRSFYIQSLADPSKTVICKNQPTCTVDSDGVLRWTDVIEFDPTKKLRSKTYSIRITDAKNPNDVFVQNVEINPGVAKKSGFFRDHREGILPQPPLSEVRNPQFMIRAMCMEKVLHLEAATVDRNLNLNLFNRYDVELTPTIQRWDDPTLGLSAPEVSPRPGPYLLSVVVFHPSAKDGTIDEVMTSDQQIINYWAGQDMKAHVDLKVRDIRRMIERSVTVAQLSFVDPSSPKDADGNFIPSQAKVLPTDFVTRSIVFGTILKNKMNCDQKTETDNWLRNQFKALNAVSEKADIHSLARSYQKLLEEDERIALDKIAIEEESGWKKYAETYSWTPVAITDEPKSLKDAGYIGADFSPKQFEEALYCLDIAAWMYDAYPAKCLREPKNVSVFKMMCQQIADLASRTEGGQSLAAIANATSPEMSGTAMILALDSLKEGCLQDPQKYLSVKKKYHVYRHEGAQVVKGLSSPLSVSRNIAIGNFIGSETLYERNAGLTFYSVALATLGNPFGNQLRSIYTPFKNPKSYLDFKSYWRKDLGLGAMAVFARPSQTAAAVAVKNMSYQDRMKALAVAFEDDSLFSPKLAVPARRIERFQWVFDYEIENNEMSISSRVAFTRDIWDTKIKATEWRACYNFVPHVGPLLKPFVSTDSDEGLVAKEARYFCFPVQTSTNYLRQRYRIFYYDAPATPLMNNATTPNFTRVMNIRGERDFQLFMETFRKHLGPYNHHSLPIPVDNVVDNAQADLPGRMLLLSAENGVLQADPPEHREDLVERRLRGRFMSFVCAVGDALVPEFCDYDRQRMDYKNLENVRREPGK